MLASVVTANSVRMPITTTTTTGSAPWRRLGADDVQRGHRHHDQDGEGLDPASVVVRDGGAGVAAERHRHHAGDDGVGGEEQPGDDAGDVPVAVASDDVLEQATGRRVAGPSLANE